MYIFCPWSWERFEGTKMGWVEGRVVDYLCTLNPSQWVLVWWSHREPAPGVSLSSRCKTVTGTKDPVTRGQGEKQEILLRRMKKVPFYCQTKKIFLILPPQGLRARGKTAQQNYYYFFVMQDTPFDLKTNTPQRQQSNALLCRVSGGCSWRPFWSPNFTIWSVSSCCTKRWNTV